MTAIDPHRLREARLNRGLTQAEVAKLAGLHRTQYVRYETGQRSPRPATAKAIADVLRVPGSDIRTRHVA